MNKSEGRKHPVSYDAGTARKRNEIGVKIKDLRRAEKISLREFSLLLKERGISVTAASINKWELGQTLPNAYQLLAVFDCFGLEDAAAFFSNRNVLNEEGMRKLTSYKEDLIATGFYAPDEPEKVIYIQMPVSLLPASAGTGDFLDDDLFEYQSFPKNDVPAGAEFGVRVDGDSMSPKYENGQIVWVRRTEELRTGEEGLFVLNGCGYIKMYSEKPAEEEADHPGLLRRQPVLISYNRAYDPIPVGPEDAFRVCGKILAL